ncbi:LOW QUALITY PROTEIN: hypothetical protein BRADI_1g05960v3 [Brachypodium distachyon]|uniref:F-box domain-containing protein n=1 Tax=Brachypodium distachyon TaxID=15368 RepID=A0A0Q3GP36_BRADI|nr:LOW QUALITY PROTEIN: hypothetical protein BRADI_1g05960v3 [Brachypodium distachyon]
MAMGTSPRLYRRLRKASDISAVSTTASSPLKRMHMSKEHNSCCEDRISNLPDDILIMILDKLDARTTITTIILSKRWKDLPRRSHTSYDLSSDEFLPPRYHRLKKMSVEAKAGYEAEKKAQNLTDIYPDRYERLGAVRDRYQRWMGKVHLLTPILRRYERQAMRCYVKRVNAFLLDPNNKRSIQKLRLQTCGKSSFIDQWITAAIGRWGVADLELVIDNFGWHYDFGLLSGLENIQLKRLVLSNCYHTGSHYPLVFQRLTTLILCKGSASITRVCDIMRNCTQLVDLRLKNSSYPQGAFHIYVATSKLKNLQLDNCNIGKIYLTSLPCLETFACRGQPTKLYYGEMPRLMHVSLDFLQTGGNGEDDSSGSNMTYPLSKFFKGMPPPLQYLVLQFRGRQIDNDSEETSVGSQDVQVEHRQHHHLKELVVVGFDGMGWQTGFVKQIMIASPRLRRVHLLDGHVVEHEEREFGDLVIVPRQREWHECERSEVLEELAEGISMAHLEIVLE